MTATLEERERRGESRWERKTPRHYINISREGINYVCTNH
jgi:hypothetical protein